MIALRIVGALLAMLSGTVLFIGLRNLYRGQRSLARAYGKPVPFGWARSDILAWAAGLLIGLALVFVSYG